MTTANGNTSGIFRKESEVVLSFKFFVEFGSRRQFRRHNSEA